MAWALLAAFRRAQASLNSAHAEPVDHPQEVAAQHHQAHLTTDLGEATHQEVIEKLSG